MFDDFLFRLRSIFRRRAAELALHEELQHHLERQAAKYVGTGLSAGEAERRARLEFGALEQVKDESREAWGISGIQTTVQDLAYGVRTLRLNPAFSVAALLSLALGIGANTAIFQILDTVRLRALPVSAPQQLAQIRIADMTGARGSVNGDDSVTYAIWEQIRDRQQAFSGVFAWSGGDLNLSPAGDVRMAPSLWVSGRFFQVLGVSPVIGRLSMDTDDRRGCGFPGAVISYAFWQSEFGGSPSAIGRKLSLNGHAVEIIGVTPAGFSGLDIGNTFQAALPLCSIAPAWFDALDAGTFWWLNVMGRLKPGWSVTKAAAYLNTLSSGVFSASLPSSYPPASIKTYLSMKLTATSGAGGVSGLRQQYSDSLTILLAISGLVLLIACANLANLMLARAAVRQREIAVRMSIGASRGRIMRQLAVESLLIAALGALLGLFASLWLSRVLVSLLSTEERPIYLNLQPDWRVLTFTAALGILTCILFGIAPALRAAGIDPGPVLKVGSRGVTPGRERFGLRRLLVLSQVSLSLVLAVCALLFVRTLQNLAHVRTGFRQAGVLVADLSFARTNSTAVEQDSYQKMLLDRIQTIPGVLAVAGTTVVPISGTSWSNKTWMEGSTQNQGVDSMLSHISSGYFRTLDVPLLAGRDFNGQDTRNSPKVAVVSEAFVRRLTKSPNPIGESFHVEATPSQPETVYRIVGVVGDAKYRSLREDFRPAFYTSLSQDRDPTSGNKLLIRSNLPVEQLIPFVRRSITEIDPQARFYVPANSECRSKNHLQPERLMASLSSAFGVLAGLLSAIGLYGVISYLVTRRRNEIGIRMALGADRWQIFVMVLRESCALLVTGLAVGTVLSVAAAHSAQAFLFELKPYDGVTLITAVALLAALGVIATYIPARRAAGLAPLDALREE